MSTSELKEKLIDKIRQTEDPEILEEISHLFQLQEPDTVYDLNEEQKNIIAEAEQQIKNGKYLTDDEADKDIDEWLRK
jgi:hypothetical protein